MEKSLIDIGQIVNTHGLKGEVKVNPWTDAPEVFEIVKTVYLENGASHKVKGVRYQKACVLLKLSDVDSVEDAEALKGKTIYTDRAVFSDLPKDTYLVADIIGLEIRDEFTVYGKIADVITTGSNDVYSVLMDDGKFIYVPAIKSVVKEISIDDGFVLVDMPKGLIDN